MKMTLLNFLIASACLLTANAAVFDGRVQPISGCFDHVDGAITLEMASSIRPNSCIVYGSRKKVPVEIIDNVLENDLVDVNAFDSKGMNSITYALINQDYEAANALLAQGADINAFWIHSPLVKIISCRSLSDEDVMKAVKYLLYHGASPYLLDKSKSSPLSSAAKRGSSELVKMFLDLGLDPNHKNIYGKTVLQEATSEYIFIRNSLPVVKLLLDRGADLSIKDQNGNNAIFNAIVYCQFAVFEHFLRKLKTEGRLSLLNETNLMGKTVKNFLLGSEQETVNQIIAKYV